MERQAQLREELCQGSTFNYLDGQYDPAGKYSIAPILPPADAWANGDRTMLCGLQTTDEEGIPQQTEGRVSEVDQANIASPASAAKSAMTRCCAPSTVLTPTRWKPSPW